MSDSEVIARLMQIIEDRKQNPPERSYTTKLLDGGVDLIGDKIREEADELIEAAREYGANSGDRQHVIHETADLIYHLLVLLGHCEIGLAEVDAELARRFGVSGLDEKEQRATNRGKPNAEGC